MQHAQQGSSRRGKRVADKEARLHAWISPRTGALMVYVSPLVKADSLTYKPVAEEIENMCGQLVSKIDVEDEDMGFGQASMLEYVPCTEVGSPVHSTRCPYHSEVRAA